MLGAGADPNREQKSGNTPLTIAVQENWIEGVQMLLRRGAAVNIKTKKKRHTPPLCAAAWLKIGDRPSVTMENGVRTVNFTAEFRNPEIFKVLLVAGADTNAGDAQGKTPLTILAWVENPPDDLMLPLMDSLIRAGAEVNKVSEDGGSALGGACHRNNPGVVKLLVAAGAEVNCMQTMGTPLDIAEKTINWCQRDLNDPGYAGRLREAVEAKLKRAQEICEILKGAGGKTKADLPPPPAPAAGAASPADTSLGVKHFLEFIRDGQVEWSLLAVQATQRRVANAYAKFCKVEKPFSNVTLRAASQKNDEFAPLAAVVGITNNGWAVILRSLYYFDEACWEHVRKAAETLAKDLKTKTICFASDDRSGWTSYELFEKG